MDTRYFFPVFTYLRADSSALFCFQLNGASTTFSRAISEPSNRYIILQRIEYAKSLLETRMLTVNEVTTHCGFSDVYYFSKTFKQICGISPSKWLWNSKSSSVKHFRFCFHFAQFKVLKVPVKLHKKPI